MELTTQRIYQGGPFNLGHGSYHVAYQDQEAFKQRTYGVQEGRQPSGPIRGFHQTSEPIIKPDPQGPSGLQSFHIIPQYEQNLNPSVIPQEMQPDRRSLYDMRIQNSAESTNGHFHTHQQWHPPNVDQYGPPATTGRLQELTPPLPLTTSITYGSVGGSHDGRSRKAPRTVNVSMHN